MSHELWADVQLVRDRLGPANPVSPAATTDQLATGRAAVDMRRRRVESGRSRPDNVVLDRRFRPWALGAAAAAAAAIVMGVVLSLPGRGPSGTQAVLASYGTTRDSGTARTALTISGGGLSASGEGEGDLRTGVAAGTLALPVLGTVTVVSAGGLLYLEVPDQYRQFTGGRPWVSANALNVSQMINAALGGLGLSQPFDPAEVLPYVQGVSGEVTEVGHDTVRGTATTHYRASIDLSRVASRATGEERRRVLGAAGVAGQALPADLWLDGAGRLRKLIITVPGTMPVTATFELWDFGVRVDAVPPPPDQVGHLGAFG